MRRITGLIIVVVLLIAIGLGGWWAIDRFSDDETIQAVEDEVQLVSVEVVRTDLVDTETLSGTLRYGDPGALQTRLSGTITAVPEAGTTLRRGDIAFEVDGQPVIVMWGDKPAWRSLSEATDDGLDVQQLESNLVLAGYEDDDLVVDEEFTEVTTRLVEEWQADLGLEESGIVELGRVLFIPSQLRLADVLVSVGDAISPGVPVLATSAPSQEVQLWLDADRQDLVESGDAVGIELPDESVTTGTVAEVADVVTTIGTGPEARRVFEVTIRLDDLSAASDLDEAPVDIEVVSEEASDVLVVPVNALLALAEGGYAIEVVEQTGASRFVKVEIGKFADGVVAIVGDVSEGDRVLVPR